MKRGIGFLGWAVLASLLLGAVIVAVAVSAMGSMDHAVLEIDGETLNLAQLGIGGGLAAIGGIALALVITLVVVVLVVPLAVLIPLAIVAVAIAGVLLIVTGVLAVVFSPLIFALLAVWLVVRLIRRDSRKTTLVGNATIAG